MGVILGLGLNLIVLGRVVGELRCDPGCSVWGCLILDFACVGWFLGFGNRFAFSGWSGCNVWVCGAYRFGWGGLVAICACFYG